MRIYKIWWKVPDGYHVQDFNDVQWKDNVVRVKNDETGEYYVIPYFSIYYMEVTDIEDK